MKRTLSETLSETLDESSSLFLLMMWKTAYRTMTICRINFLLGCLVHLLPSLILTYVTGSRKINHNAVFFKFLFFLPADSLMAEDWILQGLEPLQVQSSNYDTKRFHFSSIVLSLKSLRKRVARAFPSYSVYLYYQNTGPYHVVWKREKVTQVSLLY